MAWGYHFIIDCKECNDTITDSFTILRFLHAVCDTTEMEAHGEPIIEYLLEGTDNAGYSAFQMITTSNITAHFVDKTKAAYVDVFSCKPFNVKAVEFVVRSFFDPLTVETKYFER